MNDELLIPQVIVHRIYGTGFEWVDRAAGGDAYERMAYRSVDSHGLHRRELRSFLDRDHGTARGEREIRALFERDDEFVYPEDMTVNDIWAQVGIRWHLTGILDHAVLSPTADYLLQTGVVAMARRIRDAEAVNVYCVREIAGAFGMAHPVVPSQDGGDFAALSDRADNLASRRFQLSIVTLAHELGHLLGLPHMPDFDNCLHTWSHEGALRLDVPQKGIARHRARLLVERQRGRLPVSALLRRVLHSPGFARHRGWHFDPEDGP